MLRDIKFRGKRTQAKDIWVYGYYSVHTGHHYISDESGMEWLVDPKTVGEFTGLKDKNGKEIYEGDKVKYFQPYANKWETHTVKWDNMWACFGLFEDGNDWCKESDWQKIREAEIIGHVYETKTGNL